MENKQEDIEKINKHIKSMVKQSYEEENYRENSILEQSNRMLSSFGFVTAALCILLQILLQYNTTLSIHVIIWLVVSIILFFSASFILILLVQWRKIYESILMPKDYKDFFEKELYIEKERNNNFNIEDFILNKDVNAYHSIVESKALINNKRVKLLKASTICFIISIGIFLLGIFIFIVSFY